MKQPSAFGRAMTVIIQRTDISAEARFIYTILTTFANNENRCFPSRETLATIAGKRLRSVSYALAELEEKGVIRRVIQRGKPTVYDLLPMQPIARVEPETLATECKGEPLQPIAPLQPDDTTQTNTLATERHEPLQREYTQNKNHELERREEIESARVIPPPPVPLKDDPPDVENMIGYGAATGIPEGECRACFDYYTARGWLSKGYPLFDWQSLLRSWHATEKSNPRKQSSKYRNGPEPTAQSGTWADFAANVEREVERARREEGEQG